MGNQADVHLLQPPAMQTGHQVYTNLVVAAGNGQTVIKWTAASDVKVQGFQIYEGDKLLEQNVLKPVQGRQYVETLGFEIKDPRLEPVGLQWIVNTKK